MYFTDNRDAASFFSIGDDDKYIKPVFLSLKKPYITDGNNEIKSELGITKLSDVNKTLKQMGYDGLIMKRGFYAKGGPFVLYLAFYPNQIKSINNDGSWDFNDNNIYS
jgi:predicted transcriptional regulator